LRTNQTVRTGHVFGEAGEFEQRLATLLMLRQL
jgi:hypothetical protein